MNIVNNLLYTKNHEWIKIENGIATVGITDFAQSELGDIVFIEFPEIGNNFNTGDTIATIEAVKTVADLYSPIGGKISVINNKLIDEPELVNKDPYKDGWILKLNILIENKSILLTSSEYEKLIK